MRMLGQASLFPVELVAAAATGDGGLDALEDTATPEVADPKTWRREHRQRLAASATLSVRSATAIAKAHFDADAFDSPWEVDPTESDEPVDEEAIPQEFRRGREGTAIGSAVHGVLELVDLTDPDSADLPSLVAAQAWAESIPDHEATVLTAVSSALSSDIVQSCRTNRHWKELFVAAPVGDVTIEGYVDLLVETPNGLVVVDYKTDMVRSADDVDRKLERYSVQGAAYAVAVEVATGMPVADVQFVFTSGDTPTVRSVHDLDLRRSQVREVCSR